MQRLIRLTLAVVALAMTLLASGCVSRQVQTLASLPLPATSGKSCCWQALQQLDISYDGKAYKLTGALAQTRTGVTLVLLDPLGRRLLSISKPSINKQGETLDTYRSPELPEGLPERFLLASSMLVWWPLADWQSLPNPWHVSVEGNNRVLSYGSKPILRAQYAASSAALLEGMTKESLNQPVSLQHRLQPLAITVTTSSLEMLP